MADQSEISVQDYEYFEYLQGLFKSFSTDYARRDLRKQIISAQAPYRSFETQFLLPWGTVAE